MDVTPEIVQEAVTKAFDDIMAVKNDIDNSNEIVPSFDDKLKEVQDQDPAAPTEVVDVPADNELPTEDAVEVPDPVVNTVATDPAAVIEPEEVPAQEIVTDKIDKSIDESGKYNLFGIDINVEKTEEGYTVTLTSNKDDFSKTLTLESADMNSIFGAVEDFFNELVIKECDGEECEDGSDKKEDEEVTEPEDKSSDGDEDEEDKPDEKDDVDKKDDEDEEDEEKAALSSALASYRELASDKIEAIFTQGLLAKQLALDIVKDKLLCTTMQELSEKNKATEALIASKRDELKEASYNYLLANKVNKYYDKVHAALASGIAEIKASTSDGSISSLTATNTLKRYNKILSSVIGSKDPKVILAAINTIGKINNVIIANRKANIEKKAAIVSSKTVKGATTTNKAISDIIEDKNDDVFGLLADDRILVRKPMIRPKNVLRSDTYMGNSSLAKDSASDEMIAEIVKLVK